MSAIPQTEKTAPDLEAAPDDPELIARIRSGEPWLFEILMRRHNQRLFRFLRSILHSDGEAEDVMQEAYVRAYQALESFEGRATFSTWLLRIALHEAMARNRKSRRFVLADPAEEASMFESDRSEREPNPEERAASSELRAVLVDAIDSLPDSHRTVFVLREVEGLSTAETAATLGLSEENVKVRLHRARGVLRTFVDHRIGREVRRVFLFDGARCDRLVAAVLGRIERNPAGEPASPATRPDRA